MSDGRPVVAPRPRGSPGRRDHERPDRCRHRLRDRVRHHHRPRGKDCFGGTRHGERPGPHRRQRRRPDRGAGLYRWSQARKRVQRRPDAVPARGRYDDGAVGRRSGRAEPGARGAHRQGRVDRPARHSVRDRQSPPDSGRGPRRGGSRRRRRRKSRSSRPSSTRRKRPACK